MKKEKKINKKEIRELLEKAIDERIAKEKEFMSIGSKKHLTEYIKKIKFDKNSAVVLCVYNKKTEELDFKAIKASAYDIQAMALYVLSQARLRDGANYMDAISTLFRAKELNECWIKNNVKEEEIKDGE